MKRTSYYSYASNYHVFLPYFLSCSSDTETRERTHRNVPGHHVRREEARVSERASETRAHGGTKSQGGGVNKECSEEWCPSDHKVVPHVGPDRMTPLVGQLDKTAATYLSSKLVHDVLPHRRLVPRAWCRGWRRPGRAPDVRCTSGRHARAHTHTRTHKYGFISERWCREVGST
jgi:hypothetical protein